MREDVLLKVLLDAIEKNPKSLPARLHADANSVRVGRDFAATMILDLSSKVGLTQPDRNKILRIGSSSLSREVVRPPAAEARRPSKHPAGRR